MAVNQSQESLERILLRVRLQSLFELRGSELKCTLSASGSSIPQELVLVYSLVCSKRDGVQAPPCSCFLPDSQALILGLAAKEKKVRREHACQLQTLEGPVMVT